MSWASLLVSLVGPIVTRVLVALGIGFVTVTGIDLVFAQVVQWMTASVGGLSSDIANVLALGGVGDGIAYVLGGLSARVSFYMLTSTTKMVFGK
ncbi:DUF2523 domain-containing protein [Burkholderia mayonis]|uniref:Cobalt ABC transporter permease n=1 Tax=Burkholderia mayonis TaxID=1385591 RepID=A0A1B4FXL4_9BURK|nr:DUF2523 domain-containing protein [Burkholderia mayonis]AOJ08414.1 cobalt ABC transporter permease [Burkholderia mayonis]KVE54778.1 cobalt ABC transporter permease [Burkholderia mayonis]